MNIGSYFPELLFPQINKLFFDWSDLSSKNKRKYIFFLLGYSLLLHFLLLYQEYRLSVAVFDDVNV